MIFILVMNGNYPTEDYPNDEHKKVIKCESEKSYPLHNTHVEGKVQSY